MKTFILILLFSVLIPGVSSQAIAGRLDDGPAISLQTVLPTAGESIVLRIPIQGCYTTGPWGVEVSPVILSGRTIVIQASQFGGICLAAGDPPGAWWEYPLEIGPLSAGGYTIEYAISNPPGSVIYQAEFPLSVAEAHGVPALNSAMLIALTVVLFAVALMVHARGRGGSAQR